MPVGIFVLDFYCHEAKIAVEIDGECHEERREYDARRDIKLAQLGVETVRIPSLEITDKNRDSIGRWVDTIVDACARRTGRDPRI